MAEKLQVEQCEGCYWKAINFSGKDAGHCYMFKDAPMERCYQRKPDTPKSDLVKRKPTCEDYLILAYVE